MFSEFWDAVMIGAVLVGFGIGLAAGAVVFRPFNDDAGVFVLGVLTVVAGNGLLIFCGGLSNG